VNKQEVSHGNLRCHATYNIQAIGLVQATRLSLDLRLSRKVHNLWLFIRITKKEEKIVEKLEKKVR
jgi:hypothetical protein